MKVVSLFKKSVFYIKNFGLKEFFKKVKGYVFSRFLRKRDNIAYTKLVTLEKFNEAKIKKEIENLKYKPFLSVIIPTYNTPLSIIKETVSSVNKQFYKNFEIIIYDDASKDEYLKKYLEKINKGNTKVFFSKKNKGISITSNLAAKKASGDYLVFLDHDDTLSPNALYEVVKYLNKNRSIDYIYSDEDKLSHKGEREDPFFKPDFSYDMLLTYMYITHIRVIKKNTFEKLGGLDKKYDGAQDWDFALRLFEKKGTFGHIPKILYHWRKNPNSTADEDSGAKSYAYKKQQLLIEEHLKRMNVKSTVKEGYFKGSYKVDREIIGNPKIEIIIPFKDKVEYLKDCIESIQKLSTYKNYEICLVNNNSKSEKTYQYLETLNNNPRIKKLEYKKEFNYSLINNFAVKRTESDYVLFLNSDTKIITPRWIEEMLSIAQRKDIGAVGGLLLYKDNTIQHAGIILGLGGVAAHSHRGFPSNSNGHGGLVSCVRDVSAVTAACLLIQRDKFLKIKGFDENLKIAYNDVDLCLRLKRIGFSNIYTPYSKLYHYESKTRKKTVGENEKDTNFFLKRWKKYIEKGDPFYNSNLTLSKEDYSFRKI
jgi:GT2 family glycosyltransferase